MITADAARVAAYVESRIGAPIVPPFVALGVEKDGAIVAGAVLNGYTGPDINVTLAAKRGALSRRFLRALGAYIRDTAGCERATFETEQPAVAALALRLGGKAEGVKRNAFGPGRDAVVLGILKADWPL